MTTKSKAKPETERVDWAQEFRVVLGRIGAAANNPYLPVTARRRLLCAVHDKLADLERLIDARSGVGIEAAVRAVRILMTTKRLKAASLRLEEIVSNLEASK